VTVFNVLFVTSFSSRSQRRRIDYRNRREVAAKMRRGATAAVADKMLSTKRKNVEKTFKEMSKSKNVDVKVFKAGDAVDVNVAVAVPDLVIISNDDVINMIIIIIRVCKRSNVASFNLYLICQFYEEFILNSHIVSFMKIYLM